MSIMGMMTIKCKELFQGLADILPARPKKMDYYRKTRIQDASIQIPCNTTVHTVAVLFSSLGSAASRPCPVGKRQMPGMRNVCRQVPGLGSHRHV